MSSLARHILLLCLLLPCIGLVALAGDPPAGGGLDPSSLASGSAGNAAGIIEFCVKNNYLGGDAASSIKNALVGKLGGEEQAKADPGYTDGAKGILTGSDGTSTNLGDLAGGAGGLGDMKGKLTEKACGAVLDHAKSLL